jgi:hypothetical protein
MLTTETIKTLLAQPMTTESTAANNATFQFLQPTAAVNAAGTLARDPRCPACAPQNPATGMWKVRQQQATTWVPSGSSPTA